MGNAVKFTDRGGVRIAWDCQRRSGGVSAARFVVSDTGIGVPPEKIGQLFKPFTQADASMMRRYGGTGLGLAISKRLAKMLGGDIAVTSELGRGSTFTLTISTGETTAGKKAAAPSHGQPEGVAPDLSEAFAVELPTRTQFIQDALRDRDFDLLARLTHQLAGTAAIYGFAQVSDTARTIHRLLTTDEALQQIEAAVADLARLCENELNRVGGIANLYKSAGLKP